MRKVLVAVVGFVTVVGQSVFAAITPYADSAAAVTAAGNVAEEANDSFLKAVTVGLSIILVSVVLGVIRRGVKGR